MTREKLDEWRRRPLPAGAPDPQDDIFAYVRWLESIVIELREALRGLTGKPH